MNELIEPNLHPFLVHFVIGLLFTSALTLAVARFAPDGAGWKRSLRIAGDWMLALGLVALAAAVAAGFAAYYSVAHDGPSHEAMTTHRNWALSTAAVFVALGIWRWTRRPGEPGLAFVAAFLVAASLLAVTGWWGARLVFHHGLGVTGLPTVIGEGHDHGDGGDAHDHGATPREDSPAPVSTAPPPDSPEAMADALHSALARGDRARVRQLLAPDVLILESGGAERSLEEYASHHMSADMAFLSRVSSQTLSRRSGEAGDSAWVATETALRGVIGEREITVKSQETLVMTRTADGWRIIHIHWSNSDLGEGETPEPDEHDHGDHDH